MSGIHFLIFLLLSISSLANYIKANSFLKFNDFRKLKQEEEYLSDDIVILHTNDVHCGLIDSIGYDGLMLYKKELQKQYKYVLTVDAGDHIQGGSIGLLSKGLDIINIMNKIGYDIVAIGNHEFDYGVEQLEECNKKLNCGYISANFCLRKNKNPIYTPYKILEVGDKKIGFIGITTPQALSKTFLHTIVDDEGNMVYDFLSGNDGKEFYETTQKYIDEVRNEGADYVIIVSHLGNEGDSLEIYTSSGLLSKIDGVDAILDGHTHKIYNMTSKDKNGKLVPIAQTGTKLYQLGVLKIKTDGTITSEILSEIPQPKFYEPNVIFRDGKNRFVDPEMAALINYIINSHSDELNEKIGYSAFDLKINIDKSGDSSKQLSRSEESTLCDLVADAMRDIGKGEICLVNAGTIRVDLLKGDIILQNILDILPFSSDMIVKEVKGSDILDALEFGMKELPKKTSRFPQVSGISFKVNTKIKSSVVVDNEEMFIRVDGERRVYDVKVGGKDLDLNKTYRLSIDNYIAEGGDGYSMFAKYELLEDVLKTDNQALAIYIKDVLKGKIPDRYRKTQGRIIIDGKNGHNSAKFISNFPKIIILLGLIVTFF